MTQPAAGDLQLVLTPTNEKVAPLQVLALDVVETQRVEAAKLEPGVAMHASPMYYFVSAALLPGNLIRTNLSDPQLNVTRELELSIRRAVNKSSYWPTVKHRYPLVLTSTLFLLGHRDD